MEPKAGIRVSGGRMVGWYSWCGHRALKQRGWDCHPLPLALSLWGKGEDGSVVLASSIPAVFGTSLQRKESRLQSSPSLSPAARALPEQKGEGHRFHWALMACPVILSPNSDHCSPSTHFPTFRTKDDGTCL